MQYTFSPLSLVNALVIAIGIGVCLLCFFQITASRHLKKEVRLYFQIFFLLILFYITSHLTRQLLVCSRVVFPELPDFPELSGRTVQIPLPERYERVLF